MTTVTFADLTHTGLGVSANNNPLAVGYIAAYAKAHLGRAIEPKLFKYPDALSTWLASNTPRMACFTNYMWNEHLSCAFARQIKTHLPGVVTVMGGPNYPLDHEEQRAYLERHPEIDFFVDGEGEVPFVALFTALADVGFDADILRQHGTRVPGVHYVFNDAFVRTEPAARVLDLDDTLPSPYTSGLLDDFFDDKLSPMMQTSRGCPYSCTFCHDGIAYMNKTRAFSLARVEEELRYIEARVKTPTLQLADLNWGMFPGDVQTAHMINDTRRRSGWPRNVMVATAKNQKDRIVEMSRILGDVLQVGASVQSTDADVLKDVKRTNISLDAVTKMTTGALNGHTGSFTEIILGLPGDTKAKHIKSVYDMLDAGVQDVRLFQFILLPGTEAANAASRKKYGYVTGFRALSRCFGRYELLGDPVEVAEVQEICLGTNTMPRADYDDCRAFDLTVAIFNNGGVVKEFFRLGESLGVPRSTVLQHIARLAGRSAPLRHLYDELREQEARNFFSTHAELDAFLAQPGTMDRYLAGEFGVNHVYRARTIALLSHFETIASIAHDAVRHALEEQGCLDPTIEDYLRELHQVAIARKTNLTALDAEIALRLHFDFRALQEADYLADPHQATIPDGVQFVVRHSDAQRRDLIRYFAQYGEGRVGVEQFIQRNDSHLSAVLYRSVEYGEPFSGTHFDAPVEVPAAVSASSPARPRVLWARASRT
ncbi:MAG: hypothetical protein ABL986_07315 [Vicinamibacterales bacterium]